MANAFSIFAAFLGWALAANIMRLTGTAYVQNLFVTVLGFLVFVVVHALPIYIFGLLYGVGLIAISYAIVGPLSGIYIGSYARSENWPENFNWQTRFGPTVLYASSALILLLTTYGAVS